MWDLLNRRQFTAFMAATLGTAIWPDASSRADDSQVVAAADAKKISAAREKAIAFLLTKWVGAIDVLCDFVYEPLGTEKWIIRVFALFLAGRFFPGLFFFGIDDVVDCTPAN